ncbi:MAG: hypothetical protein BWY67_00483 [Bacteroidetes bacterium ADurb.Bin397]|nr:MAG: hypothetical protein BWY67_00483 [Bacteroidetes bacterium ADurb.Bin397]
MKHYFYLIVFVFSVIRANAQSGGDNTYEFLNLSSSARVAAMGGQLVPVKDNDLNLVFGNPALLNPEMSKQLTFSGVGYFADIKYGYAAYAQDFEKYGTFAAGMHYVNYGDFTETDNTGEVLGSFKAAEYSLNLSYARTINNDSAFTVGATLKTIYSSLEDYSSVGMAVDIGANYYFEKALVNLSLVAKNAGRQLTYYRDGNNEPLPFEIELGASKKLAKAPLRLSLVLQNLEKFDLTYKDPAKENETDPITGEVTEEKITFGDKALRHVVLGAEILLSKNFHIRAGYNFRRRNELGVETKMSTVGLSWGLGFRISKFHISYGRATYHLAGASNHFSLSANLGEFYKKAQ